MLGRIAQGEQGTDTINNDWHLMLDCEKVGEMFGEMMYICDCFEAAGIPMPKVQNFCGGVEVIVQRTTFIKMMNVADNVTSLSQVVSQVEHTDNERTNASLLQVVSQVVPQVDDTNLSLLTEVFISLQKERTLAELMAEFKQVNRGRFKSSSLDILIRAGLATPTIPDKPNSRFQKYVLTEKGRQLIERVTGTDTSDSQERRNLRKK